MKLLLLKITAWACSVFFVLMGLTYLVGSILGGLLIILAGLFINPIIYKITKKYAAKYRFELKPWISSLIAVALLVLGTVIVSSTDSFKKVAVTDDKTETSKSSNSSNNQPSQPTGKTPQELAKTKEDEQKKLQEEIDKTYVKAPVFPNWNDLVNNEQLYLKLMFEQDKANYVLKAKIIDCKIYSEASIPNYSNNIMKVIDLDGQESTRTKHDVIINFDIGSLPKADTGDCGNYKGLNLHIGEVKTFYGIYRGLTNYPTIKGYETRTPNLEVEKIN